MPIQLAPLQLATLQLAAYSSPPYNLSLFATLTIRHPDNSQLWQLATMKTRHYDNYTLHSKQANI
jgi:hypothetical protein